MKKLHVAIISILTLLILLPSCLVETTTIGTEEGGSTAVIDPELDPSLNPTRMICDPFETASQQARDRGLFGNLLYLTEDQPRYSTVVDYITNGHIADVVLYLDRLFVQTRPFDRGFVTQTGTQVQIEDQKLFEYFAINVNTELKLGTNEQPGYYQLALLADDGAVLTIIDENGQEKVIVNNDGTHPTKMGCATEPVYLDQNTRIKANLQYYQGPRYHISLVAMWRPWPEAGSENPVNDYYCGKKGNSLYFDFTQNPVVPKTPFYELLSRNWKVLENENYNFPEQTFNPCAPIEDPLAVLGFTVPIIDRTQATVTWETNLLANSQVEVKNVATGLVVFSSTDATLVNTHSVVITGLQPNTLYAVTATSTSASGQIAISDERAFRTKR